jgi:DNA-binding MarR family transcriptional regulator
MRQLWSVSHELEVLSGRMAKELGITAQQRMIIRIVGRFPGITAGRLSVLLCVDAATVSTALARLERRGLVSRERDRRDGRRVTVALTHQGRRLDVPAAGTVEAAVDAVLAGSAPADVAATHRVLAALGSRLREEALRDGVTPANLGEE